MSPAFSQRGISDRGALLQMKLGGSVDPIFLRFAWRNTTVLIHQAARRVRRSAMLSYTMIARLSCVIQITPLNSGRAIGWTLRRMCWEPKVW